MPNTVPIETVGVNVLLQLSGSRYAAQTDATLNIPQELREIVTKTNDNFINHLSGKQEWSVDQDSYYFDDQSEAFISNGRISMRVNIGTDATPNYVEFARLTSIDLNLTQNLAEVSSLDRPLWRYLRPAERSWTVDVTGNYYDEAGYGLNEVFDAKENRERLDVEIDLDGRVLSGTVATGDFDLSASTGGESAEFNLTFGGDGVLQSGTSVGSPTDEAFDLYFGQTLVPVTIEIVNEQNWFEGSAYLGDLSVSVPEGEEPTISFDLQGSGPIARAVQV